MTGEEGNECSRCEENTFGYDSITGCQECACQVEGTIAANMSCSLETGQCYCKENVEGRTCDTWEEDAQGRGDFSQSTSSHLLVVR